MIVAIDGPAASGKSTSAKLLAKELGFLYLDTGAMYRCVSWAVIKDEIDLSNDRQLLNFLKIFKIDLKNTGNRSSFYVNNKDVTDLIRKSNISQRVSEVSAIPDIRDFMVDIQRNYAKSKNCVMDGRDIGTVVFPKAEVKFFIIASDEVRAKRRKLELESLGEKKSLSELIDEIRRRDDFDSNRGHSPLKKAFDAIEIDTTDLSIDEQVKLMLGIVKQKIIGNKK
ncbi:MAG: cytidylate kinase [Candidatus Marinimicrobia bacterium]|nr:cytidylate kinase [Candidatus Neomarinimicrobiota bacterium]